MGVRVGVCRCVVEGGTWVGVGGCGCWVVVVLKTATRGLTRPTAAWFQHPVSMATASQFSMATASQVSMATAPSPWQQPRLHGNSPVSMATARLHGNSLSILTVIHGVAVFWVPQAVHVDWAVGDRRKSSRTHEDCEWEIAEHV